MAPPFPHTQSTTIVRSSSCRARIAEPPRTAIDGGPPVELAGDATSWSPEQLLLSSIGLQLLTTFDAIATRDRVEVYSWRATATATVDRTLDGLGFTRVRYAVELLVSDAERGRAALELARRHCFILNALRVPVEVDATFATPAPAMSAEPLAAAGGAAVR